jgi:hypothetical protein
MTELDLSHLPEPLRQKLETQLGRLPLELRETVNAHLARLPPEKLAQLVDRGSPMLDRLMARAEQAHDKARGKPRGKLPGIDIGSGTVGRANRTVQVGDTPGALGKILLAIAVGAVLFYLLF